MEKIITALKGRKKSVTRLTRNSRLFKVILESIKEKKGEKLVSLDLKGIDEAVADFFILCEAGSHIQVKAIADNVVERVKEHTGERPYHVEYGDQWTLIDYVNIVVHIFQREHRKFYNLETLWADAQQTEHND